LLSAALGKLQAEQTAVAALTAELRAARDAVAQEREALERLRDEAETVRRQARAQVREELAAEVEAARQEVTALIAKLQAQPSIRGAQGAQRELAERAAALQEEVRRHVARAEAPPVRRASLRPGMWVRIVSLGNEGEVEQIEADSALVRVGNMRSRVKLADLSPAQKGGGAAKGKPPGKAPRQRAGAVVAAPVASPAHRCDLRGLRIDEAERELDRALDTSFSEGSGALLVVHGHGTGALKDLVRQTLRASPYVSRFRAGDRHEGGDGVTVVELNT
jgi:DNA mismatch repair protein MutS2